MKKLMNADQIAEALGVSRRVAVDLMQEMPRVNVGRNPNNPRWAVSDADFDAWLAKRTEIPITAAPRMRRIKASTIALPGLLDSNGHIARRR